MINRPIQLNTLRAFILLAALSTATQARPADFEIGGINHLGLAVINLAASQRFFTDTLGFDLVGTDDEYPSAFVSNSENFITLWQVSDPNAAVRFDRKNNVGLHHVAFAIDSFDALDALYQTLLNAPGVIIEFSPELLGNGPTKHMMIREPSGNRIEFIHRPSSQ